MSLVGYNGRDLTVDIGGTVVAAISTKTVTMTRTGVEVPTDDSDGWMRILPEPGRRGIDTSIEGVTTADNEVILTDEWEGNVLSTVTINLPDGRTMNAEDGFFLGNLELSGEEDGFIAFTAQLRSSGVVTIAPAV